MLFRSTLALPAVAKRIGKRVQERLVRRLEEELPRVPKALCALDDRAVLAVGDDAALDASHS